MLLTYQKKPKKKHDLANMNWLRKWSIIITEKKGFEIFILASILINTIVLSSYHFMITQKHKIVIAGFNSLFVVIFLLEAVMKIIAQKLDYFKDSWN